MPGEAKGAYASGIEETKMTQDLNILQELFLPLLEEMASHSPGLAEDLARGEAFWIQFNDVITEGRERLLKLLSGYGITDAAQYSAQIESLTAEYFVCLAQSFCAGHTNPTITLLTDKADPAFTAEVAFQRDLLAAITLAGREAIKEELTSADEFAGADISDEELSAAFSALHRDAERDKLRSQLQQWDEEKPDYKEPVKRRKRRAIPLLFLRFAAAAAVGAVATIGVVKVYNNRSHEMPETKYGIDADSNITVRGLAGADTLERSDSVRPNNEADTLAAPSKDIIEESADNIRSDTGRLLLESAAANTAHLPHIVLKGDIIDVTTDELVTDVAVTMQDDKGHKHTVFSKDGKFRFELSLHHDFVITGKKENYRSARLSLSTQGIRETDADDVIEGTLKLTKDVESIK